MHLFQSTKTKKEDKKTTDSIDFVLPTVEGSSQRASLFFRRRSCGGQDDHQRQAALTLVFRSTVSKTSKQIADIPTKGSFSKTRGTQLTYMFNLVAPHALLQPFLVLSSVQTTSCESVHQNFAHKAPLPNKDRCVIHASMVTTCRCRHQAV